MVTKASVDAVLDKIDGFVAAEMDHFGTPGVAVSVVYDDVVLFSKGYGVREVGRTDPITPDTVFSLASMSKPISGTAVAHLVAKGVIAWDQPVHDHVPGLRFRDPWVTDHITFADLYSHRSGLPGLFGNTLEHIGYTRDEILARLPLIPLDPFRTTYSYSNFGMTAGGDAAAEAAGTTFEDMIEQQLFGPAGMTHTSASYADLLAEPDRSAIHIKVDGQWTVGPTRRPDAQAPAGGVSSSLKDVTTWVRLVLGGGTLDGEEIIGKDALATTHVPHIVRAPLSSYDAQPQLYGLGWNIETDHLDFLRWSHSGAFSSGASTTTVLLPQEHLGVVVLTNGMPQGVPEIIAEEILEQIALGTLTRDWRTFWYERFSVFYQEYGPTAPANPTPALADDAYLGTYANDYYGEASVISADGGLALVLGPRRLTVPLTHVDAHTFSAVLFPESPNDRSAITFSVDDGKATGIDIGDGDGPGTGQLTRRAGRGHGPRDRRDGDGRRPR